MKVILKDYTKKNSLVGRKVIILSQKIQMIKDRMEYNRGKISSFKNEHGYYKGHIGIIDRVVEGYYYIFMDMYSKNDNNKQWKPYQCIRKDFKLLPQ